MCNIVRSHIASNIAQHTFHNANRTVHIAQHKKADCMLQHCAMCMHHHLRVPQRVARAKVIVFFKTNFKPHLTHPGGRWTKKTKEMGLVFGGMVRLKRNRNQFPAQKFQTSAGPTFGKSNGQQPERLARKVRAYSFYITDTQ